MTDNRKLDGPIKFDFDFDEAMDRIAQTNPEEVNTLANIPQRPNSIDGLIDQFEQAGHDNGQGDKCWFARDLQSLLGYKKWEDFEGVIRKAEVACRTAGHDPDDHFQKVFRLHGKTPKEADLHGITNFPAMPAT